jgi:hypothetical protein
LPNVFSLPAIAARLLSSSAPASTCPPAAGAPPGGTRTR